MAAAAKTEPQQRNLIIPGEAMDETLRKTRSSNGGRKDGQHKADEAGEILDFV